MSEGEGANSVTCGPPETETDIVEAERGKERSRGGEEGEVAKQTGEMEAVEES